MTLLIWSLQPLSITSVRLRGSKILKPAAKRSLNEIVPLNNCQVGAVEILGAVKLSVNSKWIPMVRLERTYSTLFWFSLGKWVQIIEVGWLELSSVAKWPHFFFLSTWRCNFIRALPSGAVLLVSCRVLTYYSPGLVNNYRVAHRSSSSQFIRGLE